MAAESLLAPRKDSRRAMSCALKSRASARSRIESSLSLRQRHPRLLSARARDVSTRCPLPCASPSSARECDHLQGGVRLESLQTAFRAKSRSFLWFAPQDTAEIRAFLSSGPDQHLASFDRTRTTPRSGHIPRPDTGLEPVVRAVCERNGLVVRGKGLHA